MQCAQCRRVTSDFSNNQRRKPEGQRRCTRCCSSEQRQRRRRKDNRDDDDSNSIDSCGSSYESGYSTNSIDSRYDTSDISVYPTDHCELQMEKRGIEFRDVQAARKHGRPQPDLGGRRSRTLRTFNSVSIVTMDGHKSRHHGRKVLTAWIDDDDGGMYSGMKKAQRSVKAAAAVAAVTPAQRARPPKSTAKSYATPVQPPSFPTERSTPATATAGNATAGDATGAASTMLAELIEQGRRWYHAFTAGRQRGQKECEDRHTEPTGKDEATTTETSPPALTADEQEEEDALCLLIALRNPDTRQKCGLDTIYEDKKFDPLEFCFFLQSVPQLQRVLRARRQADPSKSALQIVIEMEDDRHWVERGNDACGGYYDFTDIGGRYFAWKDGCYYFGDPGDASFRRGLDLWEY